VSSKPTWRAIAATICGVWIVAALFALPSRISGHLCVKRTFVRYMNYYRFVVLFELLVSCVLPLCVIAFSYIMTARHLVKSARPISEETQNPQLNKRKNTARIVLGVTAVFLFSSVPYHAYWTYIISEKEGFLSTITRYRDDRVSYTHLVTRCLFLINTCFNPVALFCTGRAFRRQFKRYLTCCCKGNPTGTDIELTRIK
jgi:hypothetical protein